MKISIGSAALLQQALVTGIGGSVTLLAALVPQKLQCVVYVAVSNSAA